MIDDTRDRVIALEVTVKHTNTKIDDMDEKLSEIHALFLQGKGIRWFIITAAAIGSFLATISGVVFYWLNK